MAVLTRSALESSPLADLHEIASELGIDGFRRLRKAELVDTILGRQDPESLAAAEAEEQQAESAPESAAEPEAEADAEPEAEQGTQVVATRARARKPAAPVPSAEEDDDDDESPRRTRRGGRGRGRRVRDSDPDETESKEKEREAPAAADTSVEGVVDLLGNGSGFVRVSPPEPSDGDVYISAAPVRRCELVDGDRVSGPVRAPRRSERYPALDRVDTINGRPADELAEGTPFEDLPAKLPTERFALEGDDPTLSAIVHLTPIGRGSRVTIAGASFSASADARAQAIERAVDAARRQAARGEHVVLLVDTLEGLPELTARKALGAARAIVDGGSLTVIATAPAPLGGETTVVVLDRALTSTGRFPALDLAASGTLRPELLVGEEGARAIAEARAGILGAK